ncbi:response regulator [Mucilaginibacter agri]|uniref:Response regulator n=1 Tax=Mucilaginibacter agri TaxID=2695265 RepID=A0A965ZDN7_9SPHI|nr:response regulator [Mucilaginibacter agri]NCD69139.1 response regulator [Mucilaginibacter agri]
MKKILLLDDNLDIVQIVEEVLAYEQYEVKSTMQGAGFLTLIESYSPDLIIIDYRLSDANGGELCAAIKSHARFRDIPVIIFTAYMQPGLDLRKFGCDAVIAKPFDLDELLTAVQSLTGGESLQEA